MATALQQLVPGGVAQRVVDLLEPVQVHEDHGEPVPVAMGLREGDGEAVFEEAAVGEVGERVAVDELLHLLTRPARPSAQVPAPRGPPGRSQEGGEDGLLQER